MQFHGVLVTLANVPSPLGPTDVENVELAAIVLGVQTVNLKFDTQFLCKRVLNFVGVANNVWKFYLVNKRLTGARLVRLHLHTVSLLLLVARRALWTAGIEIYFIPVSYLIKVEAELFALKSRTFCLNFLGLINGARVVLG